MTLDQVPVALAFGAGLVASVNPCGFAMLPAFVSYYVGSGGESPSRVADGLLVGLALTAGFMVVFGVVGTAFSLGARAVVRYVPWLALVVGAGLTALGVWLGAGRRFPLSVPALRTAAPGGRSYRSVFVFGVAYAVASLSCTLPVFLVVIGSGFTAGSVVGTVTVFGSFALGMATILMLLSLGTASFRELLVRRVRRVLPFVSRVSGALLVAGGAYIIYYWSSVLSGSGVQGPTRFVASVQQRAQSLVLATGQSVWLVVGGALVAAAVVALLWRRPRPPVERGSSTETEPLVRTSSLGGDGSSGGEER